MIGKKVGIIIALILVAGVSMYFYMATRIVDPFIIDFSKVTVEKAAANLINAKNDYYFELANSSDRAVKLLNIELSGHGGIDMTIKNVNEMIPEAIDAGNYDLWKEELEANSERAKYFRTIGIGVKGYFEKSI